MSNLDNDYLRRHEAISLASKMVGSGYTLAVCGCYKGCQWCVDGIAKLPKRYVITNSAILHCVTRSDLSVVDEIERWRSKQENPFDGWTF